MPTNVRQDDWQTPQQFDAAQRLGDAIDSTLEILNAMKTSGVPYRLVLSNFADDAAAAIGGVLVGQLYRTGSIIKVRVA